MMILVTLYLAGLTCADYNLNVLLRILFHYAQTHS
jgi:hypothetical protein